MPFADQLGRLDIAVLCLQVLGLDGDCARVKAADGGTVKVQLTNGPSFDSPFYEFEGVVQTPEQIREISRSSFGGTFSAPCCCAVLLADSGRSRAEPVCCADLQNYNQLCEIVHSTHAPLFKS